MSSPTLHIDVAKIRHNAATLVDSLGARGIEVMGVTKASLGSPEIANAFLQAGVTSLGESHMENVEALRRGGIDAPIAMLRAPMQSQAAHVVATCHMSLNTELKTIEALSKAAVQAGTVHGVLLMVECGDLREGIMPSDLAAAMDVVLQLPGIALKGIGTNMACLNGAAPDATNMAKLEQLAVEMEERFSVSLSIVSGGNSANLDWALQHESGRINQLRLGESLLLGRETLYRKPIPGLHTDAFTLRAEVIECKTKPAVPWGTIGQAAFHDAPLSTSAEPGPRSVLALGRQDCEPTGLHAPAITILGATSDHLVVQGPFEVGAEVAFQVNYAALLQTMTSPFVAKEYHGAEPPSPLPPDG